MAQSWSVSRRNRRAPPTAEGSGPTSWLAEVEGLRLVEEQHETAEGVARARDRYRGEGDRRRPTLTLHELRVPAAEVEQRPQHRLSGADGGVEGYVVVGVDVAPVQALIAVPVAGREPQPPATAFGEGQADPSYGGQAAERRERVLRPRRHVQARVCPTDRRPHELILSATSGSGTCLFPGLISG